MAIAFDAATDGGFSGTTSHTYAHTCSGSNRILFAVVGESTGGDLVTGVTYNGVAMTQVGKQQTGGTSTSWVYLYYLLSPATGTHNVVASGSAGSALYGGCASYTGADQGSQPDSSNIGSTGNFNPSLTISTTVVAANCWLVGGCYATNTSPLVASGVDRWAGGQQLTMSDRNGVVGTGAQSITWNASINSAFGGVAASFDPDTGGGGGGITLTQIEKGPTRGVLRGQGGRIIG